MANEYPSLQSQRRGSVMPTVTVAILAALVAGGAAYAYERHQRTVSEKNLQSQIDTLRSQLASTPTPTPVATVTPTTSPSATASPSSSPTVSGCTSANLTLAFAPATGGGTAGTNYYDLALTNKGTVTCTLQGFPTVKLLNSAGTAVGTAQANGTAGSAVSLAPGGSAYAAVGVVDSGNFSPGVCLAGTKLSVTPPGQTTALTASTDISYCPGMSVGSITSTKP